MNKYDSYKDLWIHFDGGCLPRNPGGVATFGWIIGSGEETLTEDNGVLTEGPEATNNYAEYCSLGLALRHLVDHQWTGNLTIYGDSQLVIYQLTEKYKCKAPHLIKLKTRCLELLSKLGNYSAEWIKRENNSRADELTELAYENYNNKNVT